MYEKDYLDKLDKALSNSKICADVESFLRAYCKSKGCNYRSYLFEGEKVFVKDKEIMARSVSSDVVAHFKDLLHAPRLDVAITPL
ncbi:MAG: hypothetical protein DRN15_11410 [Thermoprotei archaeon]|nr:MAG: hypothetical protein DRN15_11410 [Thermoprotei archaeon]